MSLTITSVVLLPCSIGIRRRKFDIARACLECGLEYCSERGEGLRNSQIAQRLVLSEKTVDHHVSAVLWKLDVRTRAEALVEALRLGLI